MRCTQGRDLPGPRFPQPIRGFGERRAGPQLLLHPRLALRQPQRPSGVVSPKRRQPQRPVVLLCGNILGGPGADSPRFGRDQGRQPRRPRAGQRDGQHARILHQPHRLGRVGGGEQFSHLGPDPLARDTRQPVRVARAGGERSGVGRARAPVAGVKAEEAQDPQIILGDPRVRVADEAQAAGAQVGQAADRVDHRAVGPRIQRVHGEIAPHRVFGQVVRERDHRAAAKGFHVAAEGRDLERAAARDHGDGAVLDPGRDRLQPRGEGQRGGLVGPGGGRDVDVVHRLAQQRVPDRAPHDKGGVGGERVQHPPQIGIVHHRRGHRGVGGKVPGRHRATRAETLCASACSTRAVAPQM